jgi:hypothetical protein
MVTPDQANSAQIMLNVSNREVNIAPRIIVNAYSIFDSALYRKLNAEWLLLPPQRQVFVAGVEVKATLHAASSVNM